MKKVIERIVESPGAPNENDLWLNGKTLKKFQNGEWVAISGGEGSGGGSGSASSLSDMTDVDISSPSDGDTLVYNATTHKWESGSGSGCSCLAPMIVAGTMDDDMFTPGSGAPTFTEAQTHMFSGGLLYFLLTNDGEPIAAIAATVVSNEAISSFGGNGTSVNWEKYSSYFVNGTFSEELHAFIPDENEMSWSEAKDLFDYGNSVFLNSTDLTLMVSSYDSENIALVVYNDALDETYYWRKPNIYQ